MNSGAVRLLVRNDVATTNNCSILFNGLNNESENRYYVGSLQVSSDSQWLTISDVTIKRCMSIINLICHIMNLKWYGFVFINLTSVIKITIQWLKILARSNLYQTASRSLWDCDLDRRIAWSHYPMQSHKHNPTRSRIVCLHDPWQLDLDNSFETQNSAFFIHIASVSLLLFLLLFVHVCCCPFTSAAILLRLCSCLLSSFAANFLCFHCCLAEALDADFLYVSAAVLKR